MFYDISHYWVWLLIAFVIGGIVGWLTFVRASGVWLSGWFKWGAAAFVIGLVLAVFHILPGRFGFYLETALLLFGSYILGGHMGAWLKSRTQPAPRAVATQPSTAPTRPVATNPTPANVASAGATTAPASGAIATPASAPATPIPAVVIAPAPTDGLPGRQPASMAEPLASGPDNLQLIKGIGPKNEAVLNGLGYHHFWQLAGWDAAAQEWVGHKMAFPGRIEREHWVRQAKLLAAGAQTDHSRAVGSGSLRASDTALSEADAAALASHLSGGSSKPRAVLPAETTAAPQAVLPGKAPPALLAAMASGADDLKLIKGIGPKNESILNGLGYHHFSQLAAWNGDEQQWVGHKMAFPGRVEREHWVPQAKLLAAGIETDHARDVKSGKVAMNSDSDAPLSAEAGASVASSMPEVAPPLPDEHKHEGQRPLGLVKPSGGKADDLQRIRGIGPQNEERLHKLGIWHYYQISAWSHEQIKWVGSYLAFPGRIDREEWCAQAHGLETGKAADSAKRADAGKVTTSK